MEGGSLFDRLGGGASGQEPGLSYSEKLQIALDTSKAMHFLHASRVIHRDLKSANVLLDGNGRAKVADFGLAEVHQTMQQSVTAVPATPAWMAPEAFRNGLRFVYNITCTFFST